MSTESMKATVLVPSATSSLPYLAEGERVTRGAEGF